MGTCPNKQCFCTGKCKEGNKRPLNKFTEDEYSKLKATGMLSEFYPEATGIYKNDVSKEK